ncbi:hypothetical protein, partial [Niveispirillum fermenti]|uniref:hypothetical protein n=1 Tax=Niveispirillum fermenti TaxID=1233113 RepID=UPI003A8804B8
VNQFFSPSRLFFKPPRQTTQNNKDKTNQPTDAGKNAHSHDDLFQQCQWLKTTKNRPHRHNHQGRLAAGAGV